MLGRQESPDVLAVRRAATHMFTTLDVCRRKWANLSGTGKDALTRCINARLSLAHAEAASSFSAPSSLPAGFDLVKKGLTMRALQQRHDAEVDIGPIITSLAKIASDMRAAVDTFRMRVQATARGAAGPGFWMVAVLNGESSERILARAVDAVQGYENELQLRTRVVAAVSGIVREDHASANAGAGASTSSKLGQHGGPGWDADARLLLSAWVLEPHLDHAQLDVLFNGFAAEQVPTRRR